MVPPRGAAIKATYHSGPHGRFIDFYEAIKKIKPRLLVCESEQHDTSFFQSMGRVYPYDCVELHEYARPVATVALRDYEGKVSYFPLKEGADVSGAQAAIHRYSGRNIPVVLTEYDNLGHLLKA
ncbi:MAG TPA: hypothetical protein VMF65_11795 [Acidimicrobiales bacterium]|nr:hypothetical protein [Acidimicrobiales bacterium]